MWQPKLTSSVTLSVIPIKMTSPITEFVKNYTKCLFHVYVNVSLNCYTEPALSEKIWKQPLPTNCSNICYYAMFGKKWKKMEKKSLSTHWWSLLLKTLLGLFLSRSAICQTDFLTNRTFIILNNVYYIVYLVMFIFLQVM